VGFVVWGKRTLRTQRGALRGATLKTFGMGEPRIWGCAAFLFVYCFIEVAGLEARRQMVASPVLMLVAALWGLLFLLLRG
jgi:hypothetical protein